MSTRVVVEINVVDDGASFVVSVDGTEYPADEYKKPFIEAMIAKSVASQISLIIEASSPDEEAALSGVKEIANIVKTICETRGWDFEKLMRDALDLNVSESDRLRLHSMLLDANSGEVTDLNGAMGEAQDDVSDGDGPAEPEDENIAEFINDLEKRLFGE